MSKKPPHPRSDATKRKAREAKKIAKKKAAARFGKRFSNQAQRGAALAICAMLDIRLKEALRDTLVADDAVLDMLLGPYGMLGELGPKIYISYAIGLIHKPLFDDLLAISKIRNRFAHDPEAHTFEYQPISDECGKIQTLKAIDEARQDLEILKKADTNLSKFLDDGFELDQVSYRFISAVSTLGRFVLDHAKTCRAARDAQPPSP